MRKEVKIICEDGGGGSFLLFATWRGHEIGRADCPMNRGRLLIGDIKVREPYQRRGIGSIMLRRIISEATARGAASIYGSVTADDLSRYPGLLDWYRGHGFAVSPPDEDCCAGAQNKITRQMSADQ